MGKVWKGSISFEGNVARIETKYKRPDGETFRTVKEIDVSASERIAFENMISRLDRGAMKK